MTLELFYALLAIIPAAFLVIMVLIGFDTDADIDVDADVDVDVDVDADVDMDADVDSDIDSDVTTGGGPGLFSLKLILGFITGFGAFGYFSLYYNWPSHHLATASIGGFAIYYIIYRFVKVLYDFQANTQISGLSLVGRRGIVINTILNEGTGEIKVKDPRTGKTIVFRAKSELGCEIAKGEQIKVLQLNGNLAKVRSLNPSNNDVKSVIQNTQISENE